MIAGARRNVLLLDLRAQDGGFLDDAGLGELATALGAAGHEARLVRAVHGPDGWDDDLAALVRRSDCDAVVVARVWSEEVVDALRGWLTEGAVLVRLAHGEAPATFDSRFDHVVDELGLVAVLAGEQPSTPSWKPGATRELRERRDRGPAPAPQRMGAEVVGAGADRPTITGPVSGCPYLRDSRDQERFAALDMDATAVQVRGCTFCLDNTGAYVAASEQQVVTTWLEQLREIRNARGRDAGVPLEVLLTDERPHPHLPALFRALIDEPALAPIELLIKSRVDWLLEFADGALAEAAELARGTGSVLHVYLIGFESFDAEHLELFNKGHGVEDNIAAIAKLRELSERLGGCFEYRRHRAHGIVLFTPWTSPAALLENARVMREVDFHELRSEAVRTRLRLYPHTPLYHLAARDGLLVQGFSEERPDRSVEQGYDASAPWRFRDPRSETIFVAATQLARRRRDLSDPDVLELATRFALRWPGLADAPETAFVMLDHALSSWGAPLRRIVPLLGAGVVFDREIELVAAGERHAALRESAAEGELELLLRGYRAMGLFAVPVSSHGLQPGSGRHVDGSEQFIVAVAADEQTANEVVRAQRAVEAGEGAAITAMGALLGYPECCVRAFSELDDRGDNLHNERLPFLRAPEERLPALLHRVGLTRIVSHHLCTPACRASLAGAERALAMLAKVSESAADALRERLAAPVLFLDYERRAELAGAFDGDEWSVEAIAPLGDRDPFGLSLENVVGIRLASDAVTFRFASGDTRSIGADRPLLTTPSRPLAPAAFAAIRLAPLSDAIREGVCAGDYRIVSVGRGQDCHRIVLGRSDERVTLTVVTAGADAIGRVVRVGPWAIRIEANAPYSDRARIAIEQVLRALSS